MIHSLLKILIWIDILSVSWSPDENDINAPGLSGRSETLIVTESNKEKYYQFRNHILKLYCRYEYTKPGMINRIWGLKHLWLQVNGHACQWFHLQRLRWHVRNGKGAKNSKWKYMSQVGFKPTPRQSTTEKGKSAPYKTARPRGLDGDQWFNVLQDKQINKTITWQHVSTYLWLHVYWNWMSD